MCVHFALPFCVKGEKGEGYVLSVLSTVDGSLRTHSLEKQVRMEAEECTTVERKLYFRNLKRHSPKKIRVS